MDEQNIIRTYNRIKYGKLAASLALDGVGMITMLPAVWVRHRLGADQRHSLLPAVRQEYVCFIGGAVNELPPLTDFVPTLTAMWVYRYRVKGKDTFEGHLREVKQQQHDSIDRILK